MRRETENEGKSRNLSGYFSPTTKAKNFGLQQCSSSQVTSFAHKTPLTPSQVPNRLPYPTRRRMLPFQKPELYEVPSCQDQQLKQSSSNEKITPAGDLSSSSLKRRRPFEDSNDTAVKVCRGGENAFKAQTQNLSVCSLLSASLVPSSRQMSVSEQSPKSTDFHQCTKSACGMSPSSELPSTLTPAQFSGASLLPKHYTRKSTSMGAKQVYIEHTQEHTLRILDAESPRKQKKENVPKRSEENNKGYNFCKSWTPSEDPLKHHGSSTTRHQSDLTPCSSLVLDVNCQGRSNLEPENRKSGSSSLRQTSKASSHSQSRSHTVKHRKSAHSKRHRVVPDDISDIFTPDAIVYSTPKTSKPKINGQEINSSTSGSDMNSPGTATTVGHQQICMPTVRIKKLSLQHSRTLSSKDIKDKSSPNTSFKSKQKHSPPLPNNVSPCTSDVASGKSSDPPVKSACERKSSGGYQQHMNEDSVDELDLDLSFALGLDVTQSSQSSEDEELLSLKEIMKHASKIPDTPEEGTFSEPSTTGHRSCKPKYQSLSSDVKTGNYKNSLDQMLKEINNNKKSKEAETELLLGCQEELLRLAEYEEAEKNAEEGIDTEHQKFLQRYSLIKSAIREVPPGEAVFNNKRFGQFFNCETLELRECRVPMHGVAQKTLLWSSPAQLRLHVNIGLFQDAYGSHSPCPAEVTQFLFKMMSVHNERIVSYNILLTLFDIASKAAYQIVKNKSQKFEVWVPSLADVTLVLINMGASFVTLFPSENLQPSFTEGDLLEDIYRKIESPSSKEAQSTFPEYNCFNVLKYLSYCMDLCPRAYSDDELLLLLTVVGRVGLDTQLILQSTLELYSLQYKIVNNIRDWKDWLPRICMALTDLTDDHHNMCLLVQMLPDNTRGKHLRRHLSLSMISKLLDKECTYQPTAEEIKLSELRRFVLRMQPSTLLKSIMKTQREKEDMETLDQQSYYLCYSLLTLTNEASNFQIFPAHEKEQLLLLCSELDMHVKCDIRESEKCLYRSKVKDLVARISTRWSMLLQKTKPLNGKLYDFWKPPSGESLSSTPEEMEMEINSINKGHEETDESEESLVVMTHEDEEEEEEEEENRTYEYHTKDHNSELHERETEVHTQSELMDENTEMEPGDVGETHDLQVAVGDPGS